MSCRRVHLMPLCPYAPMPVSPLNALTPLDGRYRSKIESLAPYLSEAGLIRYRVRVEVQWLKALAAEPAIAELPSFSPKTLAELDGLLGNFGEHQAARVKSIEQEINHDVKAVEYWLREALSADAQTTRALSFVVLSRPLD